jgi:signal peptidase I
MKIQKRIFTALCCLLLTAQMVSAQKNMWLVTDTKQAYCVPLDSIKYGTFQADSCFRFDFTSFASNDSIRISAWIYPYGHFGRFGSPDGFYNVTPKYGICYSKTNSIPTLDDDVETWKEHGGGNKYFTHLNPGTTIYYRTYVKLGDVVVYSAPQKVKTLGRMINGHKFLDLGLPSGLLWAETNLGAKTAGDVGDYYAWGETTPKDSLFTRAGYKYYTPPTPTYSKYNGTDGLTELENADDYVTVNYGSVCRMPTKSDFIELINKCKWEITYGTNESGKAVRGYLVTSKKNKKYIFLPINLANETEGSINYWTRTLSTEKDSINGLKPYTLCLNTNGDRSFTAEDRFSLLQIRAVANVKVAAASGDTIIKGVTYVDLGLPSGLLWAKTNLGASKSAYDGYDIAWGEIDGNKKRSDSRYYTFTPWNYSKYNTTDGLTELENTDDAAYVNWGSECRMPTKEDYIELLKYYRLHKDSVKNSKGEYVKGLRVEKEYGTADIFFPGGLANSWVADSYQLFEGQLWTRNNSDQLEENSNTRTRPIAIDLYTSRNYQSASYRYVQHRYYGRPIRAVAEPEP